MGATLHRLQRPTNLGPWAKQVIDDLDRDILPASTRARVSGNDAQHDYLQEKLAAGAGVTITLLNPGGDEQLEIAAPGGIGGGEANTSSNAGGTYGLALPKSGVDLPFKGLTAGTRITLTPDATSLTITSTGEANTAANVGTGTGLLFKGKVSEELQFRSLLAGAGISITTNNDTVTVSNTGDHDHGRVTTQGSGSAIFGLGATPETNSEQVFLNGVRCRRVSPGAEDVNEYSITGTDITFWRNIQSGEWVDATFRVATPVAHTHRRDEFTSGGQDYTLAAIPAINSEEVHLNGVRLRRVGGSPGVNEYWLSTADTISLWSSRAVGEYLDVVYRT